MKIAVCIKQVPDVKSVRMDEKTGTVIRSGKDAVINPLDLHAIELALRLKDQFGARLTAVTMGPPAAEKALREAAALGIDECVLLSDIAFAGSDTWATAKILACALRRQGPFDLIICGERATDGDTSQVGPEIAAELGLSVVAYVNHFECDPASGNSRVRRRVEDGEELYSARLPLLITVTKEIGAVRLPTFRGVLASRAIAVAKLSNKELELPADAIGLAGSPTRVLKIFHPPITRECQMINAGNDLEIAAAVSRLLEEVHP